MAHDRIEVDLPLSKVYELLCNPVHFTKFLQEIDQVERINSQTYEYRTTIGDQEFHWTTNIIDNLRNTRFAWITINGTLNQTGTIRFTPLDNGERTLVDFSLDYRVFFGDAEGALADFIAGLPAQLRSNLEKFKELAESGTFKEAGSESSEDEKENEVTA